MAGVLVYPCCRHCAPSSPYHPANGRHLTPCGCGQGSPALVDIGDLTDRVDLSGWITSEETPMSVTPITPDPEQTVRDNDVAAIQEMAADLRKKAEQSQD
jgi:hypothetical protein